MKIKGKDINKSTKDRKEIGTRYKVTNLKIVSIDKFSDIDLSCTQEYRYKSIIKTVKKTATPITIKKPIPNTLPNPLPKKIIAK
ncbi:MAG: hypothetical protein GY830_09155 [Bacteroidetes bacterium]|nr:hypothetical protein [Bacteroidota bacterium]